MGQLKEWSIMRPCKHRETFGQNPCEVGRPRKNKNRLICIEPVHTHGTHGIFDGINPCLCGIIIQNKS